ncbi:uncharacterized protein LOC134785456 [Penaeus indicus]|uniref:uncharacterized protein LOC134785456 n=1 Tax=Penaeus indicus TaxID=29960 RepID=UPI00300CCD09
MLTEGGGGQCVGGEGRVGVCMLRRNCHRLGGTPTTTCAFGYGNCCIAAMRNDCGWEATRNRTYWSSPGPGSEVVTTGASCVLNVRKLSNNICSIRLNFSRFSLTPPNEGNCLRDHLAVSGQNINNFIPKLCGENSGQHMYIDVDTVPGPVELRINTVGSGFDREWEIEVTQIECSSPYRPPSNCLQYFTGSQGTFSSFNYVPNLPSQYLTLPMGPSSSSSEATGKMQDRVYSIRRDITSTFRIQTHLKTHFVPSCTGTYYHCQSFDYIKCIEWVFNKLHNYKTISYRTNLGFLQTSLKDITPRLPIQTKKPAKSYSK